MPTIETGAPTELAVKTTFLRSRAAYAEAPQSVEAIETHRSWVFLTELHAYKLKKPVSARGADYSSLGARRHHCEEEVRLNRRLASDVYLGVVPLVRAAGELQLVADRPLDVPPEGEVVDWLVLMRRVPRERMLDWQIAQGTLDPKLLASAITALARFYQRTERVAWTGKAYRSRLEREVLRYRRELDMPRFELAEDSLDEITNAQLELLHREPELFDLRAAERRIVDAHGDLRPEHIVLGPEPCVIDCIEFSRQLRLLDSASELSFLAIECARLGAPSLRDVIVNAYAEASSDRPPERLLDFYESHNACIRAVVALWHLDDPAIDSRSRWVKKARSYLRLAADRAHRLRAG